MMGDERAPKNHQNAAGPVGRSSSHHCVEPANHPPAEPVAATTAIGGLAIAYVQAGTFSVEANEKNAANKICGNGISAEMIELNGGDSTIRRVPLGPVSALAERRALLNNITGLGFTDAFTVTN